jgi:DNA replication protein DnaC
MMQDKHQHPDVMGEALGRFRLPGGNGSSKVIPLHRQPDTLSSILLEKLTKLGLSGMAAGFKEQLANPDALDLPFEVRLSQLLDKELEEHEELRAQLRLKRAGLPYNARMADIDYSKPRGLVKSLMISLSSCAWLLLHHNVVITGPAGVGKTFVASALTQQACTMGFSALYKRTPDLGKELQQARATGQLDNYMQLISKASLLVLDNLGLETMSKEQGQELLHVLDQRHGQKSVLAVSPFRVADWPGRVADPAIGKAIMERLAPNAYQINLKGDSLRTASASSTAMSLDTDY